MVQIAVMIKSARLRFMLVTVRTSTRDTHRSRLGYRCSTLRRAARTPSRSCRSRTSVAGRPPRSCRSR
jgi:hypothetical protein